MERQGVLHLIKRYGPAGPAGPAGEGSRSFSLSGPRPVQGLQPPRARAFQASAASAALVLAVGGPVNGSVALWCRVPDDDVGVEGCALHVECATGGVRLEWYHEPVGPADSGPRVVAYNGDTENVVGPELVYERGSWVLVGLDGDATAGEWVLRVNGYAIGSVAWPGTTGAPVALWVLANSDAEEDAIFPGTVRMPAIWSAPLTDEAWSALALAGPSADWLAPIGSYAPTTIVRYWPGPAVPDEPLDVPPIAVVPNAATGTHDLTASGTTAYELGTVSDAELLAQTAWDLAQNIAATIAARAHADAAYAALVLQFCGDASDGDIDITTTNATNGAIVNGAITNNLNYNILKLSAGGKLAAPQGVIFCRVLDLTDADAAAIESLGGDAAGNTAGGALPAKTVGVSAAGSAGGAGGTINGSQAGNLSTFVSNGGISGQGSKGGDGSSGTGGAARVALAATRALIRGPMVARVGVASSTGGAFFVGGASAPGGGGGGGDGVNAGGLGGGGGSGARPIQIMCHTLLTGPDTPAGAIYGRGGNGGDGVISVSGGNTGGGGGGGGAGGPEIVLTFFERVGDPVTDLLQSVGGTGGQGGPPRGSGTAGDAGVSGGGGAITAMNLATGAVAHVEPNAGSGLTPGERTLTV